MKGAERAATSEARRGASPISSSFPYVKKKDRDVPFRSSRYETDPSDLDNRRRDDASETGTRTETYTHCKTNCH